MSHAEPITEIVQTNKIGTKPKSLNEIEGQYMGLMKYTPKGWKQVRDYLEQFKQSEIDSMDMTMLLQGLIAAGMEIQRSIFRGEC